MLPHELIIHVVVPKFPETKSFLFILHLLALLRAAMLYLTSVIILLYLRYYYQKSHY